MFGHVQTNLATHENRLNNHSERLTNLEERFEKWLETISSELKEERQQADAANEAEALRAEDMSIRMNCLQMTIDFMKGGAIGGDPMSFVDNLVTYVKTGKKPSDFASE